MTCSACGSPATGGLCRDCELAARFEADDPETFETEAADGDQEGDR